MSNTRPAGAPTATAPALDLFGEPVWPSGWLGAALRRTSGHPFALAALALVLAGAFSLLVGSVPVSPLAYLRSGTVDHAIAAARLDRTVLAALVGGALALASAGVQTITRNPLGDPAILGLQSGASMAMVLAIAGFGVTTLRGYLWFGFAGVAVAALVVHVVGGVGSAVASPVRLTVTGAAVSAALGSLTSAVLLRDQATLEVFRSWQVGTVGGRPFGLVAQGAPFLVVGAALLALMTRNLNALALGDDLARGVGVRPTRDRIVVGTAVVLLVGTATALAGPVAFVGLLATHAVRTVVGPDHRRVLPLSAAWGAVLTMVADTLGRVVLPPTEVPVGIMTAVCGVPFFLWLVRSGRAGTGR